MTCNKNPEKIKNLFDEISPYYDKMNNIISFGTHYIIKYLSIRELDVLPRSMVLDLCCGTGDLTRIISKVFPRSKVIGLDFSTEMIKIAKSKNPKGVFIKADCTKIPFAEKEFRYVTMGFGLRNIENRSDVLDEIYRVLEKNGRFLHLDFGKNKNINKIFNFIVPILTKIFKTNTKHYQYLLDSKDEFPSPEALIEEFESHGFKFVKQQNFLFGIISSQIMSK